MAVLQLIVMTWFNIVGQGNESMLALLVMFFTRSDADGALSRYPTEVADHIILFRVIVLAERSNKRVVTLMLRLMTGACCFDADYCLSIDNDHESFGKVNGHCRLMESLSNKY
jgi:hypothetical protein